MKNRAKRKVRGAKKACRIDSWTIKESGSLGPGVSRGGIVQPTCKRVLRGRWCQRLIEEALDEFATADPYEFTVADK